MIKIYDVYHYTVSLYWSSPICFHYSANRVVPRFQHELADTLAFNEYVYLNDIQTNQVDEFVRYLQKIGAELSTEEKESKEAVEWEEEEEEGRGRGGGGGGGGGGRRGRGGRGGGAGGRGGGEDRGG